jgi:nucleoid-associated protein YgaU
LSRPVIIALAGFAVIVVAIAMSLWSGLGDVRAPQQPQPTVQQTAVPPSQTDGAPSFDIVRINPQGETVIAGRSAPKAEVTILDGGKELGHVTADGRGEWVFVPDQPLPAGSRELSLRAANPDGSVRESNSPVVIVVPDRTKDKDASLAVKVNPDGSIDILQGPETKGGAGTVSIGGITFDDKGRFSVTGKSGPKATLQLYLDGRPLGRVQADDHGAWRLTTRGDIHPGEHSLRADELSGSKVVARAETTFSPSGTLPQEGKVTVEKGNSLWRIARRAYGSGFNYLIIFEANKGQIRDPDRIYPGQVFALPQQHDGP